MPKVTVLTMSVSAGVELSASEPDSGSSPLMKAANNQTKEVVTPKSDTMLGRVIRRCLA